MLKKTRMEKSAFDPYIKERLSAVEHQPNKEVWGRIQLALSKETQATPVKRRFGWWQLATAAAIVGLVGSVFFLKQAPVKQSILLPSLELVTRPEVKQELPVSKEAPTLLLKEQGSKLEPSGDLIAKPTQKISAAKPSTSLATHQNIAPISQDKVLVPVSEQTFSREVSETMALALLEKHTALAQTQTKQQLAQKISQSVNASDLLLEVETDLNKTFRAKVVQEIKQNIVKISQSMALRNQ